MKKVFLSISIIICAVILLFILTGCSFINRKEYIATVLELNLDNCKIENEKDTHGGFLGDGEYFAKIICTEKEDTTIKSNWKALPISEELKNVMEMVSYIDSEEGKNAYQRYSIPNIENGYYYFIDRHSEATDKKNEENLNKRSSYNFSVGIYDTDSKTIYYYELDT